MRKQEDLLLGSWVEMYPVPRPPALGVMGSASGVHVQTWKPSSAAKSHVPLGALTHLLSLMFLLWKTWMIPATGSEWVPVSDTWDLSRCRAHRREPMGLAVAEDPEPHPEVALTSGNVNRVGDKPSQWDPPPVQCSTTPVPESDSPSFES